MSDVGEEMNLRGEEFWLSRGFLRSWAMVEANGQALAGW